MEKAWEFAVVTLGVPRKISSVSTLEKLGRVRLSEHYFMRDFLYSTIGDFHQIPNYPSDPKLAVEVGERLCQDLIEPLHEKFGHVAIRSAYRSEAVNAKGAENKNQYQCASNESNYASHIWDRLDAEGLKGATATIVIPWFANHYENGKKWTSLAWWIHDHLPYSSMVFYPIRAAFNLSWHEKPKRQIYGNVEPKGYLARPGMDNHNSDHSNEYSWIEQEL